MPLDQTTSDNASARSLIWTGLRNVAVRPWKQRGRTGTQSRPGKLVRTPRLTGSPWMRLSVRKTYELRWPNSVSIAPGKHLRTPWNTYPPRIDACKSEDVVRDEGQADPYQRRVGGSESTGHGNASNVTSGQAREKRKGLSRAGTARRDPRGGRTRQLDSVVEVESTNTDSACALTPPKA